MSTNQNVVLIHTHYDSPLQRITDSPNSHVMTPTHTYQKCIHHTSQIVHAVLETLQHILHDVSVDEPSNLTLGIQQNKHFQQAPYASITDTVCRKWLEQDGYTLVDKGPLPPNNLHDDEPLYLIHVHYTHPSTNEHHHQVHALRVVSPQDALMHYVSYLPTVDSDIEYITVQNTKDIEHTLTTVFGVDIETWYDYRDCDEPYTEDDTVDILAFATHDNRAFFDGDVFVALPNDAHIHYLHDRYDTTLFLYTKRGQRTIAVVSHTHNTHYIHLQPHETNAWVDALHLRTPHH